MMNTSRWSALALAVAVAGCGSEATFQAGPREFAVMRSTEFGDAEGDGVLSNVWGMAVSDDGHVFLSEPPFARVIEFNPDGSFARVVGARGDGPGEFRIPGYLAWRADSLAVTDFQRGICLFSADGAFATLVSFNINDGSSAFGVRPIFPLADGAVAALAPAGNSEITSGGVANETWLKTTRDGSITDTLAVLSLQGRLYSVKVKERGWSAAHPVSWAPLVAAPPSGASLVVVDRPPAMDGTTATYRVLRLDLNGDTIGTADVEYAPVPLRPEQVDSIASAMAAPRASMMGATVPAVASEIKAQVEWPAYQPPVTLLLAGVDGSVWVRRETVGVSLARWDILDETLSPIGWVNLPVGLELKVVGVDRVYGVELGDFDVPKVVRLDVVSLDAADGRDQGR